MKPLQKCRRGQSGAERGGYVCSIDPHTPAKLPSGNMGARVTAVTLCAGESVQIIRHMHEMGAFVQVRGGAQNLTRVIMPFSGRVTNVTKKSG